MPLWFGLGRGSGGYSSAATSDGANKPEDPPLFSSGQAAAGNGCIPDVSKAAAKPDADELHYVGEEHVRCVLKWESVDGQQLDLSLRAELSTADGLVIGSVHGQLRDHAQNVDNQFRECGVKHEHEALKEELSLELNLLTPNPVVDLVFVTAGVHGGQLCLGDIPRIDVSLLTGGLCDLSQILASTELSKDTTARSETRVVIAIFARAPSGGWRVAWFRAPAPGDERGGLSEEAAIALSKRMLDGVREGRVGANGQREEVDMLIAAGDIAGAIKRQEAVLQRLADNDTCSSTFEWEYNRLEELQRMMGGGASSSSSQARVEISDAARSEQNITQAQIESVDEDGYQSIVAVRDTKAMVVFIKRVMERYNGGLREPLLEAIAAQHSGEKEVRNWERLLEDLHCSTGSSSSSCAPPATTDPEESRRRTAAAINQAIAETCDDFLVETPGGALGASGEAPGTGGDVPDTSGDASRTAGDASDVEHMECPVEPKSGSVAGGTQLRWCGELPAPAEMSIGGRPCAPLAGGVFVVPFRPAGSASGSVGHETVVATFAANDGSSAEVRRYPNAFCYWQPGVFLEVSPARGPTTGSKLVRITTSDLGAPISEVFIGGTACEIQTSTSSEAGVLLPSSESDGAVAIEVRAANGNSAVSQPDSFTYFEPTAFGNVGCRVELSNECQTATRLSGVNCGVCLGAYPLRRIGPSGNRYFEVVVEAVEKSVRTIAVGVALPQPEESFNKGKVRYDEARQLEGVWVAGYDKGGAVFYSDGQETKIPPTAWRPVRDVRERTRIGVLWDDGGPGDEADASASALESPELVIYQDGVERTRLKAMDSVRGVPTRSQDLYAVVDVQGTVKTVSLVECAMPPPRSLAQDDAGGTAETIDER